ncbi:uncharacterized protein BJ212DRAFT_1296265 [Suillus subaureus]|uniref:Uncharacterized protein n=1 Tax=Suillus subaureus TaxID=48587 RepID=A0A9P7JIA8_9AGAM|nr:uncharacterized protein BJ212DRAFT_1296265 [Suillus subaureus]KAG1823696.1 hypothetical protein BJ212DRAFT_1296265 [Suillus subaureus]
MSKYSHLLSKMGASEDIACQETNLGFCQKQDLAMPASISHTAKVRVCSGGSKDVVKVKTTAANLRKMGVGSILMVTVGVLKLAVSKGPNGNNLQIVPGMTKSDIDGYLHTLFPRLFNYLENHDDDGRNNSNLTLAGTMLEVDPDSFDDLMNEVAEVEDIGTVGSNDMDESENEVSVLPKGKDSPNLKKQTQSSGAKLFATFLNSNLDSDVELVEDHSHKGERTKVPPRVRFEKYYTGRHWYRIIKLSPTSVAPAVMLDVPAAKSTLENLDGDERCSVAQIDMTWLESELETLEDVGLNEILPAEDKPALNMLLEDSKSSTLLASVIPVDKYYSDFSIPEEHMLVPSASKSSSTSTTTSTTASASTSVSLTHAAHRPRDLGFGCSQNLQALSNVP